MTKLLLTLGGGGHTAEILKLAKLLGDKYKYHFLLVQKVQFDKNKITHPGGIYEVRRPRGRHDNLVMAMYNSFIAAWQIAAVLLRVRPDAIIGSGPAISVFASLLGKLIGAKIIFVETGSRVTQLSQSGKIMYHIADLFLVQWPDLENKYPKVIYAGRL